MTIYDSTIRFDVKSDGSPVSEADGLAERIICARLREVIPDVPIIAEESFDASRPETAPARFLLVDPLDGTKEFINRRDEFTVNIALVEQGRPVVGCVYAPALGRVYLGGDTAAKAELRPGRQIGAQDRLVAITTSDYPAEGLRAVASRSHLDPETEALLARLPVRERCSAGSSLKFCVVAAGEADVYPRLAPTMEWDTAAGHAVLLAAGGCVIAKDGSPLRYGKVDAGFRNDRFIAWGKAPLAQ